MRTGRRADAEDQSLARPPAEREREPKAVAARPASAARRVCRGAVVMVITLTMPAGSRP